MVGSDDILTPSPNAKRDGALNRLKYVTTNDTKKQKNMVSLNDDTKQTHHIIRQHSM